MRALKLWMLAVAMAAGAAVVGSGCRRHEGNLRCYVGGTMQPAMEEIVKLYNQETGRAVEIDKGDSGELLIKIETTKQGDLYVAHDPFPAYAKKKGYVDNVWNVAVLTPVIVVAKGNPKNIHGFKDLGKEGMRVVVTDPLYSTAGHVVAIMAAKAGIEKELVDLSGKTGPNVVDTPRGGGEAANKVTITGKGGADAAICWDAVAFLRRNDLDIIPIEPAFMPTDTDATTSATYGKSEMNRIKVGIATLKSSTHPKEAEEFAKFVASPAAAVVWKKYGFTPMPSESTVLSGTVVVRCAAGMKLPVEKLSKEFEKEKGVKMELDFAGSEQLYSQLKLNTVGDVYIAGDSFYVDKAEKDGIVAGRKTLCYFEPVIMVAKDNPLKIKSLADLTAPGLKLGQGDPKAAAVGRLMPELLQKNGVDEAAWKKNVVQTTPTVNELGADMALGHLDAVVVWRSIAVAFAGKADIVDIPKEKNIFPTVEGAVLKKAENPAAARAFLDYLASPHGRQVMTQNGYSVEKP